MDADAVEDHVGEDVVHDDAGDDDDGSYEGGDVLSDPGALGASDGAHDDIVEEEETEDSYKDAVDPRNIASKLKELESFAFPKLPEPEEDPSGRLAYKSRCAKFDFYLFPINSIVEKFDLENLNLSHSGLGDKGAIALAECLRINQRITSLTLTDNWITPKGGEALLNAITNSKAIRRLDLSENRLGYRASQIGGATVGGLVKQVLLKNDKLIELSLRANKIGDSDMAEIAEGLLENSILQRIDLSYNEIGPKGGSALALAVQRNSELKEMTLEWNQLRNQGTMAVLRDGFSENNVMKVINLAWNGISDEGGVLLGQIIKETSSLEVIDVSHNRIGPLGAKSIALGLEQNSSLKKILLSHNPLRDLGVADIIIAVRKNNSLTKVDVSYTDAGKVATRELEETLKTKPKVDIEPLRVSIVPRSF